MVLRYEMFLSLTGYTAVSFGETVCGMVVFGDATMSHQRIFILNERVVSMLMDMDLCVYRYFFLHSILTLNTP